MAAKRFPTLYCYLALVAYMKYSCQFSLLLPVLAFSTQKTVPRQPFPLIQCTSHAARPSYHSCSRQQGRTRLSVLSTGVASLLAGSVGGAIGVGVAYPFDTIKTKAQVYSSRQRLKEPPSAQPSNHTLSQVTEERHSCHAPSGMVHSPTSPSTYIPIESPEDDLISLVKLILQVEGLSGFFGGVRAMMIGQALIKSVAFSANELALRVLSDSSDGIMMVASVADESSGGGASFMTLVLAASFSGFVTSFLVAPVERVKVMMQAQQATIYANELECIQAVLTNEGWMGLFSRGLGPTLAREVPSYAIYFVVYGVFMQSTLAEGLGSVAPLVFGAIRSVLIVLCLMCLNSCCNREIYNTKLIVARCILVQWVCMLDTSISHRRC
eukprot:CCRYP_008128-RC/>CCRYP_008128-RC protein AED:0.02 eAED:0.02 QI:243/1/1/1/0.33/0.25/4/3150/381